MEVFNKASSKLKPSSSTDCVSKNNECTRTKTITFLLEKIRELEERITKLEAKPTSEIKQSENYFYLVTQNNITY